MSRVTRRVRATRAADRQRDDESCYVAAPASSATILFSAGKHESDTRSLQLERADRGGGSEQRPAPCAAAPSESSAGGEKGHPPLR